MHLPSSEMSRLRDDHSECTHDCCSGLSCCRRLTVQLARTEEATRRAMMRSDPEARGDTAQLVMDLQAQLSRVLAERTSLQSRLNS